MVRCTGEKMEKVNFTNEQVKFIKDHGADIDDQVDVFDKISDLLGSSGFDENYIITDIGTRCEEILDILANIEKD